MDLYILLDTSGSMEGAKIGALNDCMQNIVISLQEYAFNGCSVNIDVMSFARSAKWMYDSIKPILDFDWKVLQAGGMTSLGLACMLLSDRLTRQQNTEDKLLILISDGCPTDDYANDIVALSNNDCFSKSARYAIAIGDDADFQSLATFASCIENVYKLSDVSELIGSITNILEPTVHEVRPPISVEEDDDWS